MVSEKINAAFEATARLMVGASGDEIVQRYRKRVAANAKRLGRLNSGPEPKTTPMEVAASHLWTDPATN
jgi:phosphopantetheine adenylyltransferase